MKENSELGFFEVIDKMKACTPNPRESSVEFRVADEMVYFRWAFRDLIGSVQGYNSSCEVSRLPYNIDTGFNGAATSIESIIERSRITRIKSKSGYQVNIGDDIPLILADDGEYLKMFGAAYELVRVIGTKGVGPPYKDITVQGRLPVRSKLG
jgi:hypothetical protein